MVEDGNKSGESYGADYFGSHRRNLYGRLFGVKGFVTPFLKARITKATRLLDIGCGVGFFLQDVSFIADQSGIDISEVAIRRAMENAPQARLAVHNALDDLPFGGERFDVITMFDVIEHVTDDGKLIASVVERLEAGGLFVMSTPNPQSLGHRLKKHNWFAYRDATHVNVQEPSYFRGLLQKNGLIIESERYDGMWDVPYFWPALKLIEHALIQLPSVLLFRYGKMSNPRFGENLWLVAKKPASTKTKTKTEL